MLAAHTASIYSAACTVSCAAAYTAHYSQLQLGADIIVSSNSMGARKTRATMTRWAPPQVDPHPLITSLQAWQPNDIRRQKEKEKKGVG